MTARNPAEINSNKFLFFKSGKVMDFIKSNFLLSALLLFLAFSAFYPLVRTIVYFNYFKVTAQTLFDSEEMKILSSLWPRYLLIDRINNEIAKDATIMVFRMADFAFYGERNYISYVDDKIADHVLQKTPEATWSYLREKGITHVYLPSYPLPSLYNSQLEKVLASPQLSELLYEYNGYRLFLLREEKVPVDLEKIAGEDFIANPLSINNWNLEPGQVRANVQNGGLKITGSNSLITKIDGGKLAYQGGTFFRGALYKNEFDYNFKYNKIYTFDATLIGNGYFEVFLERQNLVLGKVRSIIQPVWSGVLNDNQRTISAQFLYSLGQQNYPPLNEAETAYRLVFKLKNGEYVDIKDWSISEVLNTRETPFQVSRSQELRFESAGWNIGFEDQTFHFATEDLPLRYGLLESSSKTVFINAFDSRNIYLSSPPFYVPFVENNNGMILNEKLVPNNMLDTSARPIINILLSAKGNGAVSYNVEIACQGYEKPININNNTPIILSSEYEEIKTSLLSPCEPKYVRLKLILYADKFTIDNNGQGPANFIMQDLSINM